MIRPIVKVYDELTGALIFQGRPHENTTEFLELTMKREGSSKLICEVTDLSSDLLRAEVGGSCPTTGT